jgi:hypothetical protein
VSDWFFMVGEPIGANERRQLGDYVRGLRIEPDLAIEQVDDWSGARRVITNAEWDRRFWDAEQLEKQRLYTSAQAASGTLALLQALSPTLESIVAVHGAAAVEAARRGCTDMGLIGAAAGAASEALHLAELAKLAGESVPHPFLLKQAVFAAGHWPLGALGGRYYVF